jgi:protein-S-isoprenylcysteine O-methyltransferase Ste14
MGCTIETLSLACATLSLILFGFYGVAAKQEEAQLLTSAAAAAYRDYRAKVGLFWPRRYSGQSQ